MPLALPNNGHWRDCRQKILATIEVAPPRAASDRLRVAEPRALYDARAEEIST
jgi:hypothetical protein